MNLTVSFFLLYFVCLFVFIPSIHCGVSETIYTSTLSPNQVINSYVSGANELSIGISVCTVDRYSSPPSVTCNIQHNVDELISGVVMNGPVGSEGSLVTEINIARGLDLLVTFTLDNINMYNTFLDGGMYIQLASVDYPNGELRGQILHSDQFYASLLSSNTIPRASGTDATGLAVGKYLPTDRALDFDLVHDVTQPIATEVYIGAPGSQGSLQASLPGESPLFDVLQLTRSENDALLNDLLYLNVNSQTNPLGDIRGQLVSIDYIANGAFTALLSGENANTPSPALGTAVFSYNCQTGFLEYVVMHSVDDSVSAVVFEGTSGSEAVNLLFSLESGTSPIYGVIQLLPGEETSLYNGNLFVSIQSEIFDGPTGEISGIIDETFQFYSYLSGINVVPAVTTHYTGLLIAIIQEDNTFTYQIVHNIDDVIEIAVMLGANGENSNIELFKLPTIGSSVTFQIELDEDIIELLFDASTYIEVRTREYPFGVVRGELTMVDPCTVLTDPGLSAYSSDSFGTLRSSDTSVLSYISYADKDDDEFDVYVEVINSSSLISLSIVLIVILSILLI